MEYGLPDGEVAFHVPAAGKPCVTHYWISGDLKSGKIPLIAAHGGPGSSHDYLAILKGFRNGLVYGVKVRFPHALIMAILFGRGEYVSASPSCFDMNQSLIAFASLAIAGLHD